MADRIEREIEEILAKLDVGSEADTITGERVPTPIAEHRRSRLAGRPSPPRTRSLPAVRVNPATLLLAGAGVMVAGLLLANTWEPFIWLSFGGVVLFISAFAWSFRRRPAGSTMSQGPRQVYWRDRYIDLTPPSSGPKGRLLRMFRRR